MIYSVNNTNKDCFHYNLTHSCMIHWQRLIDAYTSSNIVAGISPRHFTACFQFTVCYGKDVNSR
jgi:hypothetical protein